MEAVAAFLKREAEKLGYIRDRFVEHQAPTSHDLVDVLHVYPDMQGIFLTAAFLLPMLRRQKSHRYLITCSWPGLHDLFTGADECWSLKDRMALNDLTETADVFYTHGNRYVADSRNLLYRFANVLQAETLHSLRQECFSHKTEITCQLPQVPSVTVLPEHMQRQLTAAKKRVALAPVLRGRGWQQGRQQYVPIGKGFWTGVIGHLLDQGWLPVLWQSPLTYDLSPDFADSCVYLTRCPFGQVLAGWRQCHFGLDAFAGTAGLYYLSRIPFVSLDERDRYFRSKDHVGEGLWLDHYPHVNVFSHVHLANSGRLADWRNSFLDAAMAHGDDLARKQINLSSHNQELVLDCSQVHEMRFRKMRLKLLKGQNG